LVGGAAVAWGTAVGAGAVFVLGACVGAGVGFGDGALLPLLPVLLPPDDAGAFFSGFFFLGSDLSAGSAADPVRPVLTDTEASSTGLVPSALLAFAVPPPSEPPPPAPATTNATANAATAAATMIPI
jgi:hypothetical protein